MSTSTLDFAHRGNELKISTIFVDEGTTMKRIRPRAKGRADRILKRSCHITVKVADGEG